MNIRKITKIEAITTDGKVMERGKTYFFSALGKVHCGKFIEITAKGSLKFDVPDRIFGAFTVNIMPGSIKSIYEGTAVVRTVDKSQDVTNTVEVTGTPHYRTVAAQSTDAPQEGDDTPPCRLN